MRAALAGLAMVAGCMQDLDTGDVAPPNTDPLAGCALACHGTDSSNAPPRSVSGVTDTTSVAVGAHQQHLIADPTWHAKVECADCHVVPTSVSSPGHIDGDNKAEVIFSMRVGPNSTWNGTTCTVGCHGQVAWGGKANAPNWTKVDGTQSACGSCHGAPPPAPHPTDTNCATCHPTMEENVLSFRDPDSHINGKIDVVGSGATGGCTSCHGSPTTNAAPPKDLAGNTAVTFPGVGAHQAHLRASSWHNEIVCSSCHVVPQTLDAPGHRDGDNIAEVKFDTLNPIGLYTKATTTCSNMYCHGNGRTSSGTKSWLATGPLACGSCHSTFGQGMSGQHSRHVNRGIRCSQCHGTVVDANKTIIKPELHINGVHEVKMANGTFDPATRRCQNVGCHGSETW